MMHPNDVCKCGDYRHQHKNGIGRCIMPDDLTHGFKPCVKFELSEPATGDRYTHDGKP
jgi:hypothetical protein